MSTTQSIAQAPADGDAPDSKIWACPNDGCGYHIADGPTDDGEQTTTELIQEHLEYECPRRDDAPVQPDPPLRAVASALREIADKLDGLDLAVEPSVRIDIQPRDRSEADEIATCDAVAVALFGAPASAREMSNGHWHHNADGGIGPVRVSTYTRVTPPAERERAAELERLRADLAEREAELDNLRARAAAPQAALATALLAPDAVPGGAA